MGEAKVNRDEIRRRKGIRWKREGDELKLWKRDTNGRGGRE